MIKLSVMIHSSQEEISIIPTKIKISEVATITGVEVEEAVAVEDTKVAKIKMIIDLVAECKTKNNGTIIKGAVEASRVTNSVVEVVDKDMVVINNSTKITKEISTLNNNTIMFQFKNNLTISKGK